MTKKLASSHKIVGLGGKTVGDFWSWAYSNVVFNLNRAALAEYLVAVALGQGHLIRTEWEPAYDIKWGKNKIEVKASGLCDSHSPPTFSISKKSSPRRLADCYVFCLHKGDDPLDTLEWDFFVVSTKVINSRLGNQKSISLGHLKELVKPVSISELKSKIRRVLQSKG